MSDGVVGAMSRRAVPAGIVALALLAGCCHTEPFGLDDPAARGPFTDTLPLRLTFNPGDDMFPSVRDGVVAFTRREPARGDRDHCLAVLAVGGGALQTSVCAGGQTADGFTDAWLSPAVGPDGQQLAYVRQRGLPGAPQPSGRELVVAALASPELTETVITNGFQTPAAFANGFRKVRWVTDSVLRFLAGSEIFNTLTRDTVFTPLGLYDVRPGGAPTALTAAGVVTAWAPDPDGSVWLVPAVDPVGVHRLAPGTGAPEFVTRFGALPGGAATPVGIDDLTIVDGVVVVVLRLLLPFGGGESLQIVMQDLGAGSAPKVLWSSGRARRVEAVGGDRRFVAEVLLDGQADLWVLEAR